MDLITTFIIFGGAIIIPLFMPPIIWSKQTISSTIRLISTLIASLVPLGLFIAMFNWDLFTIISLFVYGKFMPAGSNATIAMYFIPFAILALIFIGGIIINEFALCINKGPIPIIHSSLWYVSGTCLYYLSTISLLLLYSEIIVGIGERVLILFGYF